MSVSLPRARSFPLFTGRFNPLCRRLAAGLLFMAVSAGLAGAAGPHLLPADREDRDGIRSSSFDRRALISRFSLARWESPAVQVTIFDSLDVKSRSKRPLRAALGVLAVDAGLWAYNRYLLNNKWARISLKSILANFRYLFQWDNNHYQMNHLMHPLHGVLFYGMARAQGLDFLESLGMATLGSIFWEFCLESGQPSINDFLTTSMGGAFLGEVVCRLYGAVKDRTADSGAWRSWLRMSFLKTPPEAGMAEDGEPRFDDLLLRKSRNAAYLIEIPFGLVDILSPDRGFSVGLNFEGRKALDSGEKRVGPYDWFMSRFRVGYTSGRLRDIEILTDGFLFGRRIPRGIFGLFGVYDYVNTSFAEKNSAVGFGPGAFFSVASEGGGITEYMGCLYIMLGGANFMDTDIHYDWKTGRSYHYLMGPGLLARARMNAVKMGIGEWRTVLSLYRAHSVHNLGDDFILSLSSSAGVRLSGKSRIELEYRFLYRNSSLAGAASSLKKSGLSLHYVWVI
jgi:hypothetical protein